MNFASSGSIAPQNPFNLVWLVLVSGSFNFDATFTKKSLNSFAISVEFLIKVSPYGRLFPKAFTCTNFLNYLINTAWIVFVIGIGFLLLLNHFDGFISP